MDAEPRLQTLASKKRVGRSDCQHCIENRPAEYLVTSDQIRMVVCKVCALEAQRLQLKVKRHLQLDDE